MLKANIKSFMNRNSKFKRFLLGAGIVFVVLYLLRFGALLSSRSYPYAQEYAFEVPVKVLYDHIKKFKADNPEYDPSTKMNLKDDTFSNPGYIDMYLIYKEKNTLVHLNVFGNRKSFMYFDALNNLSDEFKWNGINRDFDRSENLAAKREFRQRFLDKLNLHYKDKGNGAWVFWK